MKVLRTPDERFAGLPGWPYAPHYATVVDADGTALRLAYVDEGPPNGAPVLLLHGEPSWSYLYRAIIADLLARGRRVLAPDLIGFGRSDKPAERGDYTYERHVAWMGQWLLQTELTDITLFAQDWGGLIGLRLVAAFPEVFAGVVIANTGLPVGRGLDGGLQGLALTSASPRRRCTSAESSTAGPRGGLSPQEIAAYDAPFPDDSYKAGAREFPVLVPVDALPTPFGGGEQAAALEEAGAVREALRHGLQRRRRGDPRRREGVPDPRAGRQGPAARHPLRRPLPAGGQPRRDRRHRGRRDRAAPSQGFA